MFKYSILRVTGMKKKLVPVETHLVVHGIAEKDGKILLVQEKMVIGLCQQEVSSGARLS